MRPGDFTEEGVLNDVNIKDSSYVLVVAEELRGISDESMDARSFLACNLIHNINPDIYIIAQLLNVENSGILRKTVNNIEIVVSDDMTVGLLSSPIVTPGISKLVNSLIIHSQDNIVKLPISKLGGTFKTFYDLLSFCRRHACNWLPLAVERDGEMFINPKEDFELEGRYNMYCVQTEMDV